MTLLRKRENIFSNLLKWLGHETEKIFFSSKIRENYCYDCSLKKILMDTILDSKCCVVFFVSVLSEPICNCTTSSCGIFSNSLYYLYPFNIEYHIFVSAMLFVMWKNIGRNIDLMYNRKRPATKTQGLVIGPQIGRAHV